MLKEKHRRFVEEYLLDLNAKKAAVRAGYSSKSAHSLLTRPDVAALITERTGDLLTGAAIRQDDILSELKRVAFGEERDSTKMKALELLGKYAGLFSGILPAAPAAAPDPLSLEEKIALLKEAARTFA